MESLPADKSHLSLLLLQLMQLIVSWLVEISAVILTSSWWWAILSTLVIDQMHIVQFLQSEANAVPDAEN
jgi:hypothetical protein